jgi:hypothetical protein
MFAIALALVASAWLAYATTAPGGSSGSSGGVTTTTTKATTTTTICKSDQDNDQNGQGDDKNGNDHGKGDDKAENNNDKNHNGDMDGDEDNQCPPPVCKPGNGFGDKNHCHTGPPGQDH